MTGFEIALFILGVAFIIISFFIVGGNERSAKDATRSALDNSEYEELHEAFVEKTNRKADLILHDTEDKLESLSNDKIIAVGEYSDQVLEKIEGNDKKVTFLYQMLNDKEEELKATVLGMENTRIDCEKLLREVASAKEAVDKAAAAAENRLSAAEALANSLSEMSLAQTQAANMTSESIDAGKTLNGSDTEELNNTAPAELKAVQNSTKTTNNNVKPAAVTTTVRNAGTAGKAPAGTGRPAAQAGGTARRTTPAQGASGQTAAQKKRPAAPQVSVSEMRASEGSENLDTGEINRNDEIIALHKSGKSIMEISKLLGMGQGEVKLIIDLYC